MAGRVRLVRQLLTESLVLSCAGGLMGLLVAQWTLHFFRGFELPGGVRIDSLALAVDGRMLIIALAVSILTGLLFGLAPAWRSAHGDVMGGLAGTRNSDGPGTLTLRHALVGVQIALCLTLLFGAGLFLRTVDNGYSLDPGFQPDDLALARFDLGLQHYPEERATGFADQLVERVSALPGVEGATLASLVPFGDYFRGIFVTVDGYEPAEDEEMRVDYLYDGQDYFETLGIRIALGAPTVGLIGHPRRAHRRPARRLTPGAGLYHGPGKAHCLNRRRRAAADRPGAGPSRWPFAAAGRLLC